MAATVLAAAPPWQPGGILAKDRDLALVVGERGVAWGLKPGTRHGLGQKGPKFLHLAFRSTSVSDVMQLGT